LLAPLRAQERVRIMHWQVGVRGRGCMIKSSVTRLITDRHQLLLPLLLRMSCTYSIPNMHANGAVHHTLDPTTHTHTHTQTSTPVHTVRSAANSRNSIVSKGHIRTCGKKNGHDRTVQTRVSVWSSSPRVASTRVSCRVHRATADAPSPEGREEGSERGCTPPRRRGVARVLESDRF
jgi:hypothetical protein